MEEKKRDLSPKSLILSPDRSERIEKQKKIAPRKERSGMRCLLTESPASQNPQISSNVSEKISTMSGDPSLQSREFQAEDRGKEEERENNILKANHVPMATGLCWYFLP